MNAAPHNMACYTTVSSRRFLALCVIALFFWQTAGAADLDLDIADDRLELRGIDCLQRDDATRERRWFVLVGIVNVYPGLKREELITDVLDPVIRVAAPTYRGTRTFSDMRDEGLLWTPQIAVGRVLSRHFALSVHAGYSAGPTRTKKKNPSLLLGLPFYSDVRIKRYAAYVGLDLDYYPWGMVEQKLYETWKERLRGARPTLGARYTWTRAGFDARVRLGPWPVKQLLNIHINDDWTLPNITLVAGVDIPISQRNTFIMNGGYSFFWKERRDFAGPAFTVGWRYML